jgi:hypothetical protein
VFLSSGRNKYHMEDPGIAIFMGLINGIIMGFIGKT